MRSSFFSSQVFGLIFFFVPLMGLQASLQADVIRVQEYAAFLNQNAKDDLHALYDSKMESDLATIQRQGAPGNYRYVASFENAMSPAMYINNESAVAFFSWEKNRDGAASDSSSRNAECFNQVDVELRLNIPCSSPLESASRGQGTTMENFGQDLGIILLFWGFCYCGINYIPDRACACLPRRGGNADRSTPAIEDYESLSEGDEHVWRGRFESADQIVLAREMSIPGEMPSTSMYSTAKKTLRINLQAYHDEVARIQENAKNNLAENLVTDNPRQEIITEFYDHFLSTSSLAAQEKVLENKIAAFEETHRQAQEAINNPSYFHDATANADFMNNIIPVLFAKMNDQKIEIKSLAKELKNERRKILASAETCYNAVPRFIPREHVGTEWGTKIISKDTQQLLQTAIEKANSQYPISAYPDSEKEQHAFLRQQLEKQYELVSAAVENNQGTLFVRWHSPFMKNEQIEIDYFLSLINVQQFPFLAETVAELRNKSEQSLSEK